MKYRAILFDFDGTLTPSLPLWAKAFQKTLEYYGVNISIDEATSRCLYRPWDDVAREFSIYTFDDFLLQVRTNLLQTFLEADLYPFVREVLNLCRNHLVCMAVVTSSPRPVVVDTVARLELSDLIDLIVTGDDVSNYKPHPEPVISALEALGVRPSEALMVGDSEVDMHAGKAAGTFTALFAPKENNYLNYINLSQTVEPDFLFSRFIELPRMIGLPDIGANL